jgi:NAD(P)-dependent dehydrogenase (short-subunit alcohol dehydrogenase family)
MTSLFIVTGASRGLGRAMAEQLFAPDTLVLALARTINSDLERSARAAGARCEQWTQDLADGARAAARLESWLQQQRAEDFARATLINNAGLMHRVGPIDRTTFDDLAAVLRVDLEAPLLLTQAFLRATRDWHAERRVLNISSGAGRTAFAAWAGYCAAKAGLDHASRVIALDEARLANPARIVSLAPGVIDTQMQTDLRAADPRGFPDQQRFIDFHARSELASPAEAARRVLTYLARPDFGSTVVADVRNA